VGRPSLAEERIATILAATGRSIARNGVNGTTLEKVAAESGMSRSHIRHYVGNRADLIALFRTRILQRYAPPSLADAEVTGISATEYALNFLFDHEVDLDEYAGYSPLSVESLLVGDPAASACLPDAGTQNT